MNFLDGTDFSRQFPSEVVACPANPEGNAHFQSFANELPFWGITQFHRKLIYSFHNGVAIAQVDPQRASILFDALAPETQLLFLVLDRFNEAYRDQIERLIPGQLNHRDCHRATVDELVAGLEQWAIDFGVTVDQAAWSAFMCCVGIIERQRGGVQSKPAVEQLAHPRDSAQFYLEFMVVDSARSAFWSELGSPLKRFCASCYRRTKREGPALLALMNMLVDEVLLIRDEEALKRYVSDFHLAGIRTAREEPEVLSDLIADINDHLFPDCAAANARLFREYVGPDPAKWTSADLWSGIRAVIRSQKPHFFDSEVGEEARIGRIALIQRMLDAALWSGLFAGRPEAFAAPVEAGPENSKIQRSDEFRPDTYFDGRGRYLGDEHHQRMPAAAPFGPVGEYLPPLAENEAEIVMIGMQSVTGDVISVRARKDGEVIRYSVVDEHETVYTFEPKTSREPLTLGGIKAFLWGVETEDGIPLFNSEEARAESREAMFYCLQSAFYAGLQEWLESKLVRS